MANVIRLSSGGTIQVRTGVLAGVGPQGPRGLIGPAGPDGPQGPQGEQGAQGQILQIQAKATTSAATSVPNNTATLVAFGTVQYDDMSVFASSTNFTFDEAGDYLLSAFVVWGSSASGTRTLTVESTTNGVIWGSTAPGITDMYQEITVPYRVAVAEETLNLKANQSSGGALNVVSGAIVITRIGSGPVGPAGPQGAQGIQGLQGVPGPQGDDGNASSGFATYADLV